MNSTISSPASQACATHYDPHSGDWDGQLPNPDVLEAAPVVPDPEEVTVSEWPSILDRDQWNIAMAQVHDLSTIEAIVHQRICFHAGIKKGKAPPGLCTVSIATLCAETRAGDRAVRKAITSLTKKGLVLDRGLSEKGTKILTLPVQEGILPFIPPRHQVPTPPASDTPPGTRCRPPRHQVPTNKEYNQEEEEEEEIITNDYFERDISSSSPGSPAPDAGRHQVPDPPDDVYLPNDPKDLPDHYVAALVDEAFGYYGLFIKWDSRLAAHNFYRDNWNKFQIDLEDWERKMNQDREKQETDTRKKQYESRRPKSRQRR